MVDGWPFTFLHCCRVWEMTPENMARNLCPVCGQMRKMRVMKRDEYERFIKDHPV